MNDGVCGVNIIYSIDMWQFLLIHCHLLLVRMNRLIGSREQMMKECQELSSHLEEFNSPVVFCHNDLMCKNIIYSEEKGIVDWTQVVNTACTKSSLCDELLLMSYAMSV